MSTFSIFICVGRGLVSLALRNILLLVFVLRGQALRKLVPSRNLLASLFTYIEEKEVSSSLFSFSSSDLIAEEKIQRFEDLE